MGLWIKWSAQAHKDAVISGLTDTQFRAFLTILEVAKEMRKAGQFRDRRHLATVIGFRLARCVPRLISEGLLVERESGLIIVSGWSHWQVDATSPDRQQRYRAQKADMSRGSDAVENIYRRAKEEKNQTLTNTPMSIGEILAQGGKK